jgi:hypothetical protein
MTRELIEAAQAMLDAFGGNVPDWLRPEAERLQRAIDAQIEDVGGLE